MLGNRDETLLLLPPTQAKVDQTSRIIVKLQMERLRILYNPSEICKIDFESTVILVKCLVLCSAEMRIILQAQMSCYSKSN